MNGQSGFRDNGQLSAAVVGLGWWGKIIIGALQDSTKIRVTKTVDRVPAVAAESQLLGIDFTTDFDAVLADPKIGAVILCTPHPFHARQTLAAAAAKKHVFCEKPLTLTRSDAVAVVNACEANGVVLGVGHEHRFKPAMIEILRLVRAGELGTIQMTEGTFTNVFRALPADNWRLQKEEKPSRTMAGLGIHGLDLCIAVNGPAESVVAKAASLISPTQDTFGILVTFKSGATAVITSALGPPSATRFAVFGDKGWLELRDKAHPQAPEGWTLTMCRHGGRPKTVEYPATSVVRANLEAFADAVAGRTPYPLTHTEMIATIAAFEAIGQSVETGEIVRVVG
jgi:predicted dehydrogenase